MMSCNESPVRIGMILPSGNILAESQIRDMVPATAELHVTRLRLTGSSDADLDGMLTDLSQAASLVADTRPDLIAFNCTAVSTRRPGSDSEIAERIERETGYPAITTGTALIEGLRALNARKIVLVTPYIDAVVARETAFFEWHGVKVLGAHGAGINSNWDMAQEPEARWQDMCLAALDDRAEAYVLSCTAIRSHRIIAPLEEALQRPVLTSNQALAWLAMRRTGVAPDRPGFGRLMKMPVEDGSNQ
jgi:maleate isomerase